MSGHAKVKAVGGFLVVALLVVMVLAGCTNGATPSSTILGGSTVSAGAGPIEAGPLDGMPHVISAAKGHLNVTSLTIALHTGVVFMNGEDDSPIQHQFAATDGSFDTGPLDAGVRYVVYFEKATTVNFIDKLDTSLTGSIVVSSTATTEQVAPAPGPVAKPTPGPWLGFHDDGPTVMNVEIKKGQAVNFYNAEKEGGASHHIVADDGSFDSGVLPPDHSYTYQFNTAGTFAYHDALNASLKGTITVK